MATMCTGIASLRKADEFCDFKIICGRYTFHVHKIIVAAQSKYFQVAFKADRFREGKDCIITLKAATKEQSEDSDACDDPEFVSIMVNYFYEHEHSLERYRSIAKVKEPDASDSTSKLAKANTTTPTKAKKRKREPTPEPSSDSDTPGRNSRVARKLVLAHRGNTDTKLMIHASIFAIATKYQVSGLQELAARKFASALALGWNHEAFADVIPSVFTSTPETATALRDLVVAALLQGKNLAQKPEIEAAVCSVDSLAYTLFKKTMS
ncbi:hypothetical protein LTR95_010074 [Oleoguttula sp. CCFEE 5521]